MDGLRIYTHAKCTVCVVCGVCLPEDAKVQGIQDLGGFQKIRRIDDPNRNLVSLRCGESHVIFGSRLALSLRNTTRAYGTNRAKELIPRDHSATLWCTVLGAIRS